jgi:hypothetical protein
LNYANTAPNHNDNKINPPETMIYYKKSADSRCLLNDDNRFTNTDDDKIIPQKVTI